MRFSIITRILVKIKAVNLDLKLVRSSEKKKMLQVQELHRLYSVQKMLMKELKGEKKQTRLWSPRAGLISQHHLPCGDSFWVQDDPSSRELSSSCSGDTLRMARGLDLKRANQEGVSTAFNAIDEAHQHPEDNKMSLVEESEVELTLSIGTPTSRKKKPENHQPNRSLELACSELTNNEIPDLGSSSSFKSDRGDECSDLANAASSSSATTEDYRKQPLWLFQGLSLNRTQLWQSYLNWSHRFFHALTFMIENCCAPFY